MSTSSYPLLSYLRRSVPLWVGVVFIFGGCAGMYTGLTEWQSSRRFEREAPSTQAAVIAKSLEAASRENDTGTKYTITYRFTAGNGERIEQTEQVSVDDWERLDEGSSLEVRFLPSAPSTARWRPLNPWWVPPLITVATALFVLIGGLIARPGVRRALVIARVQRAGVTTQGTVLNVWETATTINRVRQWRLGYEFRDRVGGAQRGESDLLAPHEAADWQVGAQGAVRYDPEQPGDSLWLGRA